MPSSLAVRTARSPSCRVAPRPCTMIAHTSGATSSATAGAARTSQAGAVPPSTSISTSSDRQPDGGRIRIGRTAPPAAPGRGHVPAVDGSTSRSTVRSAGRIGQDPADPRVPAAAVEEESVHALHRGVGRGGENDLQRPSLADHGQHFLVLCPDPGRGDDAAGEVEGEGRGAGGEHARSGAAADDAPHRPLGAPGRHAAGGWRDGECCSAGSGPAGSGLAEVRAEAQGGCHGTGFLLKGAATLVLPLFWHCRCSGAGAAQAGAVQAGAARAGAAQAASPFPGRWLNRRDRTMRANSSNT